VNAIKPPLAAQQDVEGRAHLFERRYLDCAHAADFVAKAQDAWNPQSGLVEAAKALQMSADGEEA